MKLQSTFDSDDRFKLDERFRADRTSSSSSEESDADDADDNTVDVSDSTHDSGKPTDITERDRNLEILQSLTVGAGPKGVIAGKKPVQVFK